MNRWWQRFSTIALIACAWQLAGCDSGDGSADPAPASSGEETSDVTDGTADTTATDDPTTATSSPPPYPEPWDWEPNRGPGGPAVTFDSDDLFQNCLFLPNDERDTWDHHNLHVMYDGYLLKPWAPEWGNGGLAFYRFDDPCNAELVGGGYSDTMRESHSIGFSHIDGAWAVVNAHRNLTTGGIQFWDISNPYAPEHVSDLWLDGYFYPDAYARVVLSVFWQAPYVYAAQTDMGVVIIDATDPREPEIIGSWQTDPVLRAGQVHAIGDLLIVTETEGPRTVLLDISDPTDPQPIPGGDFIVHDHEDVPRSAYFSNFGNGMLVYARKDGGSGIILYDISNPSSPTRAGSINTDGSGGYVFMHDHYVFSGQSSFAALFDISDLSDIQELGRFHLTGDLDTLTPIGNVALVSVDDEANPGEGTAVAPWTEEPDSSPPYVNFVWPPDGSDDLAPSSRIGIGFNEMIDVRSAFDGSIRLYATDLGPELGRVLGHVSAQENIANFWPIHGLQPDTDYTLEVPAGGIVDFNGNAIEEPFTARFRTR